MPLEKSKKGLKSEYNTLYKGSIGCVPYSYVLIYSYLFLSLPVFTHNHFFSLHVIIYYIMLLECILMICTGAFLFCGKVAVLACVFLLLDGGEGRVLVGEKRAKHGKKPFAKSCQPFFKVFLWEYMGIYE